MVMPITLSVQRMRHGDGFNAYMLRNAQGVLDPFLGVDHAWMSAPTFPPHSHSGFSAVSYLFLDSETSIHNRDSIGTDNTIRAGGVHWTTAGVGVIHEEVPAETDKTVHSLQIFVDLSIEKKNLEPYPLILEPENVPVVRFPGVEVRVPIGSFFDMKSPLTPPSDVTLLDILIEKDNGLSVPVEAGKIAFAIPIFGKIEIGGDSYECEDLKIPLFPVSPEPYIVEIKSSNGRAGVAMFVGSPLHTAL